MGALITNLIAGSGLPGADFVGGLFKREQKYQNAAESQARMAAVGAPPWFLSAAYNRAYFPETKPLGDKQRDLMEIASAVETLAGGNKAMSERQWVSIATQLQLDVPPGLSMEDSWLLAGGGSGDGAGGAAGFGGGGGWPLLAAAAVVLYLLLRR